jgi:hypothetical protein
MAKRTDTRCKGGDWYLIHHGGGFLVSVAAGDGALAAAQHIVADGVAASGVGRRAAAGEQGILHLVNDQGPGLRLSPTVQPSLGETGCGCGGVLYGRTVLWSTWADLASYCCSPLRRMHVGHWGGSAQGRRWGGGRLALQCPGRSCCHGGGGRGGGRKGGG